MIENNKDFSEKNNTPEAMSLVSRIAANDALKKGIAGAIAGALVATVTEVLWPSDS